MKIWMVLAACVGLGIALLSPSAAGSAARIYLIALVGVVGLLGTRALLRPPPLAGRSQFTPTPALQVGGGSELPEEYRRIKGLLSFYNTENPLKNIDPVTRNLLRSIALQRVYYRHGLRLDVPDHEAAIRAVVSPDMWRTVGPQVRDNTGRNLPHPDVPAGALPALIDELERL
jgi:hypothetical protein